MGTTINNPYFIVSIEDGTGWGIKTGGNVILTFTGYPAAYLASSLPGLTHKDKAFNDYKPDPGTTKFDFSIDTVKRVGTVYPYLWRLVANNGAGKRIIATSIRAIQSRHIHKAASRFSKVMMVPINNLNDGVVDWIEETKEAKP